MPDNIPQQDPTLNLPPGNPQTTLNTSITPYAAPPPYVTPFQNSKNLIGIYQAGNPQITGQYGSGNNLRSLPTSLQNVLKGKDPYFNSADVTPITTAQSLTDRYINGPAGYSSYQDNEDANAKAQWGNGLFSNFWQKQANGSYGPFSLGFWATLPIKTAGKVINGFGNLYDITKYGVHGVGETITGKDDGIDNYSEFLAKGGDSYISQFGNWVDQKVGDHFPLYQETKDTQNGLFYRLFTDADMWNGSIKDGAAFSFGSIGPVFVFSELGLGARLAGYIGKTATGLEAGAEATETIGAAGKILKSVNSLGRYLPQANIAKAVDYGVNLAYSIPMESSMEARGVGLTVYNSSKGQINPMTGKIYTEDELYKISGAAASQVYHQNLIALSLSNSIELFGLSKIFGLESRLGGKAILDTKDILAERAAKVNKFWGLSKESGAYKVLFGASVGILTESYYEENVQYAIQKLGEQYGATDDTGYGNSGVDENGNMSIDESKHTGTIAKYLAQTNSLLNPFAKGSTDKELNESVFLGALLGVYGGALVGRKDFKEQNKFTKEGAKSINSYHQKWMSSFRSADNPFLTETDDNGNVKFIRDKEGKVIIDPVKAKGYVGHIEEMDKLQDIINGSEHKEDPMLFEMSKNFHFTKMAAEYAKYGATDQLIDNLSNIHTLKAEDINVLFPELDTSKMDTQEFKDNLNKKVTDLINISKEMEQSFKFIEKNVLQYKDYTKEELDNYNNNVPDSQKAKNIKHLSAIMFTAKKQWLLDRSAENLSLKLYANSLRDKEISMKSRIAEIDSNLSPLIGTNPNTDINLDSIEHDKNIEEVNNLITKHKALQNHIVSLEQIIKDKVAKDSEEIQNEERRKSNVSVKQPSQSTSVNKDAENVSVINPNTETKKGVNVIQPSQNKGAENVNGVSVIRPTPDISEEDLKEIEKHNKELLELQDQIEAKQEELRKSKIGTKVDSEGYHSSKNKTDLSLEKLDLEGQIRVNQVRLEETKLGQIRLIEDFKNVVAPKEAKTADNTRKSNSRLSRNQLFAINQRNKYYEREVRNSFDTLNIKRLWDKKTNTGITKQQYEKFEKSVLTKVRIRNKVLNIQTDINGQKILTELNDILSRDLSPEEFDNEIKGIIERYSGQSLSISEEVKQKAIQEIANKVNNLEDERNFLGDLGEVDDPRFNEKYYNNENGLNVIKPEYYDFEDRQPFSEALADKIKRLETLSDFIGSIQGPKEDVSSEEELKRIVADSFQTNANILVNLYDKLTDNQTKDIEGDLFSSREELDSIEDEIKELEQLKEIFKDRTELLDSKPFEDFIQELDNKIKLLNELKDKTKERLNSRLAENRNFLIDSVNNIVNQLGIDFNGETLSKEILDEIKKVVSQETLDKLISSLAKFNEQKVDITTENKTENKEEVKPEEKKQTDENLYWDINGQAYAIQEILKANDKSNLKDKIKTEKERLLSEIESNPVVDKFPKDHYKLPAFKYLLGNNIMGSLQLLTNLTGLFTQTGKFKDITESFYDDQSSSPVYKFREDFNLNKFIRNVEKDTSRDISDKESEVNNKDLLDFLKLAKQIKDLEDLDSNLNTSLNLFDQIELEKSVAEEKRDNKKDNKYADLNLPSIQQLFFIRRISSFLKTKMFDVDKITSPESIGFKNWAYIQAPGGAGKSSILGQWFNLISDTPRDRVLATAFSKEASETIRNFLLTGEDGPKNTEETIFFLKEQIKNKNFNFDTIIIDEFPANQLRVQEELFYTIRQYSYDKLKAGKGELKVITMGDTNQLTFTAIDQISHAPAIILNSEDFGQDVKDPNERYLNHPGMMTIIPSLTVNFRSNLFAINSFIEYFKNSSRDNVNEKLNALSSNPRLDTVGVKGVVSLDLASFKDRVMNYLNLNKDTNKTRAIIVNENKVQEYKDLLKKNNINVVENPNDEDNNRKNNAVYVTTVGNSQGFSFDEVFIDFINKDKMISKDDTAPEYLYNKAMYVATSRAKSLIVITNFPNAENIEDQSIETLELKSLEELKTKDDEFIKNRESEINAGINILGKDNYDATTKGIKEEKAKPETETVLDDENEDVVKDSTETTDENNDNNDNNDNEDNENIEKPTEPTEPTVSTEAESPEKSKSEEDALEGNGSEKDSNDNDLIEEEPLTYSEFKDSIMDNIKDKTFKTFNKIKASAIRLLFPTGTTLKYRIKENKFAKKLIKDQKFEHQALKNGDSVHIVAFQKTTKIADKKNPQRVFGYAIVTEAKNNKGEIIPDSYRTVSVLSDNEIDNFGKNIETKGLLDDIKESEKRNPKFVSLSYNDIHDKNGFKTNKNKFIKIISTGKVLHSNSVSYFYNKNYKILYTEGADNQLSPIIEKFITSFYKDRIDADPKLEDEIRKWYNNKNHVKIIIPIKKDIVGENPNLKIPDELKDYIKMGRPYIIFKSFDLASTDQFIPLSRRNLHAVDHEDILKPIKDFVSRAKDVKKMLKEKGIEGPLGFSKGTSVILSSLMQQYNRDRNPEGLKYTIPVKGADAKYHNIEFTLSEATRIKNLYDLFSVPAEVTIDGEKIYGNIESVDAKTGKIVIIRATTGERIERIGNFKYTSSKGPVQVILNQLINSNKFLTKNFIPSKTSTDVGFVTLRSKHENIYDFMSLLGAKENDRSVPKAFDEKTGLATEYYEDVIEIIESLLDLKGKGTLRAKNIEYLDEENNVKTAEAQFRVHVPITSKDEDENLQHDYTNTSSNTSRTKSTSNSKYFETNFENIVPSSVYVDFSKSKVNNQQNQETQTEEKQAETSPTESVQPAKADIERRREEELKDLDANNYVNNRGFRMPQAKYDEIKGKINAKYDAEIADLGNKPTISKEQTHSEVKKQVHSDFNNETGLNTVLVGSVSRSEAKEGSDIDIVLEGMPHVGKEKLNEQERVENSNYAYDTLRHLAEKGVITEFELKANGFGLNFKYKGQEFQVVPNPSAKPKDNTKPAISKEDSNSEVEAKKADIERRRQEDLKQASTIPINNYITGNSPKEALTNFKKYLTDVLAWENLKIGYTKPNLEFNFNGGKDITAPASIIAIGGGAQSVVEVDIEDVINAKYDAELSALNTQTPTQEVKNNTQQPTDIAKVENKTKIIVKEKSIDELEELSLEDLGDNLSESQSKNLQSYLDTSGFGTYENLVDHYRDEPFEVKEVAKMEIIKCLI